MDETFSEGTYILAFLVDIVEDDENVTLYFTQLYDEFKVEMPKEKYIPYELEVGKEYKIEVSTERIILDNNG